MLTYMLTFVNLFMLSSILNNIIYYRLIFKLRLKVLHFEI